MNTLRIFVAAILATSAMLSPLTLAQSKSLPIVEGVVRTVDKSANKLTIKHGPIPNLDMGGMTMVFRVQDPAMFDKMKEGDKINFAADKVQGAFTVIKVEPAK